MSNKPASLRTRINRLNKGLRDLTTNKYFERLPLCDIGNICTMHGFATDDFDGIYCGRQGRATISLGEKVWMNISWYKMDVSGRYEVVAYASKGAY